MTYVLLDDKFWSNGKTVQAGNEASGVYVRALSYCGDQLTDGWVPLGWAREITKPKVRTTLVDVGFWVQVEGGETFHFQTDQGVYVVTITGAGYFIPDYLLYNPTSDQVERKRGELSAKRSAAGKLGAHARWHGKADSNADGNPDGNRLATAWQPDSPLPQPLSPKEETPTRDAAPLKGLVTHEYKASRLIAAAGGGPTAQRKIANALRGHSISEYDLDEIIDSCTKRTVKDPLAVALSELVKRRKGAA